MTPIRSVILVVTVALLAGCASAPKPALPDGHYTGISQLLVVTHKCGEEGMLPPDVAATGMGFIKSDLNKWDFDDARLKSASDAFQATYVPTKVECNALATQIHNRSQRNDVQARDAAQKRQGAQELKRTLDSNRAASTVCHQVGTQNICTTN